MTQSESSASYGRRRRTAWTRMRRVILRYGPEHELSKAAIAEWQKWRAENPSPRPVGRPRKYQIPHSVVPEPRCIL